jgi:FSR family fosmidomycin resistance protein-like MFS transporter
VLGLLLTTAGLGIAAYHPEAAALAGSCAPEHRSRAMSIFTMGGFLGQATGPIYSGNLVDAYGLSGMTWTILAGLAIAALLTPLGRGTIQRQAKSAARTVPLRELMRGQVGSLSLVLVIGSLRIIAAGGVPLLVGYLLEQRGASAGETGQVQAAFMLGIGLGGLACATLVRHHHERVILWLCPLIVVPVLLAIPRLAGIPLAVGVCLSGLLLGISLPVLISYGQQLMPGSQRVASSITMGVSWGLGGAFVSLILLACQYAGRYEPAFVIFAIATTLSSILCIWLPAIGAAPAPPALPESSIQTDAA